MLKWLAGTRPRSPLHDVVTDDPLAAIRVHQPVQRPLEIYAVSRVNPLFDDEVHGRKERRAAVSQAGDSDSPHKSSSSGYGSPRYHSSSEYSSGTEEINGQRVYVGSRAPASLRHDALTVLEQNVAFVKSILVAARRQCRRPPQLSPIPEGNLDHAIPRPVWPRRPKRDAVSATLPCPVVDDALLVYATVSLPPPTEDVLRELSNSLTRGLGAFRTATVDSSSEGSPTTRNAPASSRPPPPPEHVLRELSDTLSRGLGALRTAPADSSSGEGSPTTRKLPSVPPAPGNTSSNEGSPAARKAPASGPPSKESDDDTQPRESTSTSSRASSSGFSDATPSPLANSARLYGSLRRPRSPGAYEKLGAPAAGDKEGCPGDDQHDRSLWTTYVGTGVVRGDVHLKADTKCYYPSLQRPDFTLDAHSAERLMRRIESAKRRRCWCRAVTSLLGLVFFLLAVMAVSLLLTCGERFFGSL